MAFSERLAPLFTAIGFPDPAGAIDAVLSYTIGMRTTEAAWLGTVAKAGETESEFIARLLPAAQRAAAPSVAVGGDGATGVTRSLTPAPAVRVFSILTPVQPP
jgi:hypothetical protein